MAIVGRGDSWPVGRQLAIGTRTKETWPKNAADKKADGMVMPRADGNANDKWYQKTI